MLHAIHPDDLADRDPIEDDERQRLAALVAAGRFVVISESPRFCPMTDAVNGSFLSVLSDHATYAEAEAARLAADDDTRGSEDVVMVECLAKLHPRYVERHDCDVEGDGILF